MAELRRIGVQLTVEGVSEYRSQLADARRAIKEMSMETRTALAELGTGANRTDIFNTKMQGLTTTYGKQADKLKLLGKQNQDYTNDNQKLSEAMGKMNTQLQDERKELKRLGQARDDAYKKHRNNSKVWKEAADAYDNQAKKVAELEKEYTDMEKTFNRNSKELTRNNTELKKTEMQMALTKQEAQMLAEEYRKAGGSLAPFADQLQKIGDKSMQVGGALKSIGGTLTKSVTAPLMGVGLAASKMGIEFEHQMNRVKVISGATGQEFEMLSEHAKKLGRETVFTAREVGGAMEIMAQAGFSATETMDSIAGAMDLAAVAGGNVTLATEAVVTSLRAFGLEASESARVADVFAKATTNSNTTVESMAEAMKYAAPMANSLGLSIEDTATAISLMGDAGIKGSMAGTTLRSALSRLANPTSQASSLMEELGINIFDANGQIKPLSGIVEELTRGLSGMTREQQAAIMSTLFGQRAMNGMMVLMEAGAGTVDDFSQSLVNAGGSAQQMADDMLDTTHGKLKLMLSALESAAIEVSAALAPTIIAVAEKVTELAQAFAELDVETQKTIVKWAALAAAAGPVLSVTGSLVTTFGGLANASSTLVRWIGRAITSTANLTSAFGTTKVATEGATTAMATAAGAKGVAGVTASLSALLPVLGAVGVALAGYGIWKVWGEEAYNAAERTKRWGVDVGEAADNALTSMQGATSEISQNYHGMVMGLQGDTQTAADNIVSLSGTVQEEIGKQTESIKTFLETYGNMVSESTREILENTTETNAKAIEQVQRYADQAQAIREREANSAVDISAETSKMLMDLSVATAAEYIKTLGLTEQEQNSILQALTGNVENATYEQALAWTRSLGEQRAEMKRHHNELRQEVEAFIEDANLTDAQAEAVRKDMEAMIKATEQGLDSQIALFVEKYPEIAKQVNLSNGEMINAANDTSTHLHAINEKIIENGRALSQSMRQNATENIESMSMMADEATAAGSAWNAIVLEAKEGDFETDLPKLVTEATQSAADWNNIRMVIHDANIDSNALSVIGEAAIANGWWEGMAYEDKTAILQDEFTITVHDALRASLQWDQMEMEEKTAIMYSNTPEKMTETLAYLGLWEQFEVETKNVDADNYGFISSIRESEEHMAYWQTVSPEVKELLGDNYDILTKIFQSEEALALFQAMPDVDKAIIADNSYLMTALFESEEAYNRFNSLDDLQKQFLADNTDFAEKVLTSEQAYQEFLHMPDLEKHLKLQSNAPETSADLQNVTEYQERINGILSYARTDTNADETVGKVENWNKTVGNAPTNKKTNAETSTNAPPNTQKVNDWIAAQDRTYSTSTNAATSTNAPPNTRQVDAWTRAQDGTYSTNTRATTSTNARQNTGAVNDWSRSVNNAPKKKTSVFTTIRETITRVFSRNATGNPYFEGGLTYLGDGGKREPYLTPSGEFGVSGSRDELYHLPRGTRIWPSRQALRANAQTNRSLKQYLNQLPQFARGGTIQNPYDGYTGLVGEAGPEIFQIAQGKVSITPVTSGQRTRVLEQQNNSVDMTETNQLLEQVIQLLAQGHVIEMDKREVARTVQPEINSLLTRGFERNNTMKI